MGAQVHVMLTPAVVAERLGVHESTVRRLVHAGELTGHQLSGLGGSIRISEEDLRLYLERSRRRARGMRGVVDDHFPGGSRP